MNSDFLIGWFVPCDTGLWQNNLLDIIVVVKQPWCKFNTPLSLHHGLIVFNVNNKKININALIAHELLGFTCTRSLVH